MTLYCFLCVLHHKSHKLAVYNVLRVTENKYISIVSAAGCGPLNVSNGDVSYDAAFLIGSVATYSCDASNGYVLTPGSPTTRTCTMSSGWNGVAATCECKTSQHQILCTHASLAFLPPSQLTKMPLFCCVVKCPFTHTMTGTSKNYVSAKVLLVNFAIFAKGLMVHEHIHSIFQGTHKLLLKGTIL